ncbi:SHOCT domain-containing protein [Haloimpatiens lingqiaonensis]|uniref:SHOCT domain-containing protein n=1 Tax=Haloimpatiens lingqiaonensis TaxID=1380675 RepID=UPI0010FD02A6|nr:SHOCT domain-containing protein [Haloimpatiens lingqiaonensis]NLU43438.1 bacteriochlorophyll 4-vinyl reductase [Acholeplasmataceae bacterium]
MEITKKINAPSLVSVISTAIQIPGVKVNRDAFLQEQFNDVAPELLHAIIDVGPVEAGCSRKELRKIASKIVQKKTLFSTGASFLAGMPGGFTMAATIPGDMLQFYGVALGLAQEIAYLYGAGDLWNGDILDEEKVTNQLILYCGVMLGASGAAQTIRVLSSSLAKQALKKLPQQALTKTFYYPIIKSIAKAFGAKMTKEVFAKGVSKVVPIIGGIVSGGITFATLRPMGMRLADTLDEAHFSYSEADFESDWNDILEANENEDDGCSAKEENENTHSALEKIQQAKQMLDSGVLTEEEFAKIKEKLIAEM